MDCSVIIAAGGLGSRFGSNMPKQFHELDGVPLIIRALKVFDAVPEIKNIVVAVNADWREFLENKMFRFGIGKVKSIIDGGIERQDSVWNALNSSETKESDIILVHDAVRPLVTTTLIQKVVKATLDLGAVIPALKPKDTMKVTNGKGIITNTLNRSTLAAAQTPQGYWREILFSAFQKARSENFIGTDSASLVERAGYRVTVIEGEESNLKITTPLDMKIAELILNERKS